MQSDLDGSFSCVVATASQLGFVKDQFALKPLLYAETDDFVAIATEEIAFAARCPAIMRCGKPKPRSPHMAEVNCEGRSIREINSAIKSFIREGKSRSRVTIPADATTWALRF